MSKQFKKIYLEITNVCNLKCQFCPGTSRHKQEMSLETFKKILQKLKDYTDYLYFHLMGEPLLHSRINEFINLAAQEFKINITTNGYLITKIENNHHINQLNISLQAIKNDADIDNYLQNIFHAVDKLHSFGTIIIYRLWNEQASSQKILAKLENYYKKSLNGNNRIDDGIYVDKEIPFIWPDLNNEYYTSVGSCMGLRNHIGILVNGDIVPCCLDYNGSLTLGNILTNDLDIILQQERARKMQKSFLNNKKCEELCRHCNFYDRIRGAKKVKTTEEKSIKN